MVYHGPQLEELSTSPALTGNVLLRLQLDRGKRKHQQLPRLPKLPDDRGSVLRQPAFYHFFSAPLKPYPRPPLSRLIYLGQQRWFVGAPRGLVGQRQIPTMDEPRP
ncbi:hypothetical protein Q31a_30250 [Aureliella helgolandensis]|uniref:Uncharacterized protein n=1 Tax=Aureliella helgolandensis TaxID=2527968 RepID=A0A518G7Z1_9BACT|nr:hypothetical protein Q31a_30250 [Aureliella helgolandensis]